MCGIVGLLSAAGMAATIGRTFVQDTLQLQHTRGPDDRGTVEIGLGNFTLTLGHNRLSVIDLSVAGHQPMTDRSSAYTITYNGEIYNYIELKRELEDLGAQFGTRTDTEVILEAYRYWGLNCLSRFNGMFAFAIVDAARHEIILVRDRFGVKPLYFIKNNSSLAFASVSRALARQFLCAPSLEYVARGLAYLVYENGSASAPFVGIEAVKPGTAMVVKIQGDQFDIREHRYYDLSTSVRQKVEKTASHSPKYLTQELDTTLEHAVTLRLRADVPIAVSLSGGVDSSLISAIAAEHHPGITGFCYGHPDARRSEGPTAARFARSVGVKPRFLWPRTTKQIIGAFEETIAAQDGPFYGLSIIAQNFVFREIRAAGFKVALGGQGGDESFLGYRKFAFFALIDAWRRRSLVSGAGIAAHLFRMLFAEAKRGGGYWLHRGRYLSKPADLRILNITAPSTFIVLRTDETFVGRQIRDVVETSLPTLLRYEDGNSLGHSVESRLPFLDYHVVELGVALPLALKLNRGFGKWCLREIGRDRLTKEIRFSRAKWGFAVTQDWINEGLGRHLRERITAALPKIHGFVRENVNVAEAFSDRELNQRHRRLAEAIAIVWLADQM